LKHSATLPKDQIVVINGSGRGEKDLFITMKHFNQDSLQTFLKEQII